MSALSLAKKARAEFETALRLNPDDVGNLADAAREFDRAGNTADATRAYETLLARQPTNESTLHDLAGLYQRSGHLDQAVPLLRRLSEPRQRRVIGFETAPQRFPARSDVLSYPAHSLGRRLRRSLLDVASARRASAADGTEHSHENEKKKTCSSSADVYFIARSLTGSTLCS